MVDGFTQKYGAKTLVYFELHSDMYEAIQREKRIKKWNRAWKIQLIEQAIPTGKTCRSKPDKTGSPPSRRRHTVSPNDELPAYFEKTGPRFLGDDDLLPRRRLEVG